MGEQGHSEQKADVDNRTYNSDKSNLEKRVLQKKGEDGNEPRSIVSFWYDFLG
jgi:hypothetical protein